MHGQFEDSVPKEMPVRYEMQRCPVEINVLAVIRRNSSLPTAVRGDVLESPKSTLDSLPCSALINGEMPGKFLCHS